MRSERDANEALAAAARQIDLEDAARGWMQPSTAKRTQKQHSTAQSLLDTLKRMLKAGTAEAKRDR